MNLTRIVIVVAGHLLMSTAAMAENPTELSETYQDWVVRCSSIAGAQQPVTFCEMSQELRHADSGQRVLAIGIQDDGSGNAGVATVIAPFGLRLSNGLGILVQGRQIVKTPFETCLPTGCIARFVIDAEALEAFRRGAAAEIAVTANANGEDVLIDVSLLGFTAAWDRLRNLSNSG